MEKSARMRSTEIVNLSALDGSVANAPARVGSASAARSMARRTDFSVLLLTPQTLLAGGAAEELVVSQSRRVLTTVHSVGVTRAAATIFSRSPARNGATPSEIALLSPFATGTPMECASQSAPRV